MGYVELHFHLLPGVDDGPGSMDDSLALAAAAVADGTRTVVATPHIHPQHVIDPGQVPERISELSEHLRRERIHLDLLAGGELAHQMVHRLTSRQLEAIAQGPPGKRWLLLEGPFSGLDASFTEAADELRERGFAVLVAHPERIAQTPSTVAAIQHELAAGSALQLTAWSVAGLYGEHIRAAALGLLRARSQTVIASDAHGGARTPALRLALDALARGGEQRPSRFAAAIPRALLERGIASPAVVT